MKANWHERTHVWWIKAMGMLEVGRGLNSAAGSERPQSTHYRCFVLVRGGSFQMGDVWGDSPWAMKEVPVHEVQVDDFLLARHETTVGEFERFVKATGHKTVVEV